MSVEYVKSPAALSPIYGTHVFAGDGLNDVLWRGTQQLRDDGELVHVYESMSQRMCGVQIRSLLTVLAREQRLALKHFSENASCTPDIDRDVVLLPCEHDFGRPVVPSRDISGHLRILDTREAEITDLETRQ